MSGRWLQALERPVDNTSLAVFRIVFGLLNLVSVVRFWANGWIEQLYLDPTFHFTYYGFSWVRPLPAWGMYLHVAILGLLSLLIMVGLWYRVATVLFFFAFTWLELIEKATYLNHYYFISLVSLLMIFMPLNRSYAIDAARRPEVRSPISPAWVLWTLRSQLGLTYFFAGVAKLKPDWLIHAQPLKIWLAANVEFPVIGPILSKAWVAHAMSIAGAAFDLTVFFFLLNRRSRPLAWMALVGFHLATARLFNIGMFPWIMIGASTLFFEPDWPKRLFRESRRWSGIRLERTETVGSSRSAWVPIGLGLYFALQILMPLRHFLYPGDVCWTEEGFRFSWNVMLVEKSGQVDFVVTEPATGKTWTVNPRDQLSDLQVKMMATQPDMLLEFGQKIARDFRSRGHGGVEVRAKAWVAYNGRSRQLLIDPTIDLAKQEEGLFPKPWILPLPEDAR